MRNVRLVERFTWRPVGLVALFAMAMLASSCGQNQEQETRETPAPAEEQTESSSGSTAREGWTSGPLRHRHSSVAIGSTGTSRAPPPGAATSTG